MLLNGCSSLVKKLLHREVVQHRYYGVLFIVLYRLLYQSYTLPSDVIFVAAVITMYIRTGSIMLPVLLVLVPAAGSRYLEQ